MVPDSKTNPEPQIKDFFENHTDATVSFTITADKAKIDEWEQIPKGGLYAKFKLTSTLNNTNMTVFDPHSRIIKYEKPEDIMKEFYNYRVEFYIRRKALLVQKLEKEQRMLSNKARFVEEVCSGALVVSNRKKVELLNDLQQRGYALFDNKSEKKDDDESEDEEESTVSLSKGYEYLLGMKIWSLTFEKAEELRKQLEERTAELAILQATSPSQIWLSDLDNIEVALDERDIEMEAAEEGERLARSKNKKHQDKKKAEKKSAFAKRGNKKITEWESDLEDDSDDDDVINESSDEEVIAVKKNSARRPTGPIHVLSKATAPKQKAAKANGASKIASTQPLKAVEKDQDVVDAVELSLAERMAKLLSPSKAQSIVPSSNDGDAITTDLTFSDEENSRGTKRPSPRSSDSDDESRFEVSAKAPKPQAKRTKAAATKKAAAKKTVPPKIPATKGRKKNVPEPQSDSEEEFDFDDEIIKVVKATPAPRAGRAARATTKKVVYTLSSDEEGSDSDF